MYTKKKFEKEFFEEWATDYDERRNKSFLEKSKQKLKTILEQNSIKNGSYLEIGLGTGEFFEISSNNFGFSVGTDISEGMVRKTKDKNASKNLFVGDACNLPLKSELFDFILCQDVLEHVPYQKKLILEIYRLLKTDGIGIITTPNPLWAPVLYVAEKLKMKVEEGEHKFVFLPKLVKNTLRGLQCEIISDPYMMIPIKTKLDSIIEPLSHSFLSGLGFSQMCVIKK
jgi:ubiquinone/menaquinone biosynthesis C-methylase UbiE